MSYGAVYVIQAGYEDLFKVGYTKGKTADRLKALQTGCPYPLRIFAEIPTYFPERLEKIIHSMLVDCRKRGEWFEAEPWVIVNVLNAPLGVSGKNGPWQLLGDPLQGVEIAPTSWSTRDGRPVLSCTCITKSELEAEVYRLVSGLFQLLKDFSSPWDGQPQQ